MRYPNCLRTELPVRNFIQRHGFSLLLGGILLMPTLFLRADVIATVTCDNNYAFGFGDVNGINPNEYWGCVHDDDSGIFGCDVLPQFNVANPDGPERYELPGLSYDDKYIYLMVWADGSGWQGVICQFEDTDTGQIVYSGKIPNNAAGTADHDSQWEVFATGIERGEGQDASTAVLSDPDCGQIFPGGFRAISQSTDSYPGCPPGTLAEQVDRWNCHIARANSYNNLIALDTPGNPIDPGLNSPGWVNYLGPVLGASAHPYDLGPLSNDSVLAFDPNGNIDNSPGGYYRKACTGSGSGLFTQNMALVNGYRKSPSWMWYNPDTDLVGPADHTNPFEARDAGGLGGPFSPEGEWLIFRVGPLETLFNLDCPTENIDIHCGAEDDPSTPLVDESADYLLTFDFDNNTGASGGAPCDVIKLVVPEIVAGVQVSFPDGTQIRQLANPVVLGQFLAGVQLHLNGGSAGDPICIPVSLIGATGVADDPLTPDVDESEFECCVAEVCVELPPCGCSVENATIECGADGNVDDYTLTFDLVNDSGEDVTKLVVPGASGASLISFPDGTHVKALTAPLLDGGTLTGVQLHLSGGSVGDVICIPVGLVAETDNGTEFQCCGTEVCIELPPCDCYTEDVTIECGSGGNLADYTLTFEVFNESGIDATNLVVASTVNGVDVSFAPNSSSHSQPLSIANNQSAMVTLYLNGGAVGDLICIRLGLLAIDVANESLFECCAVEVCVKLPSCCMDVSKTLSLNGDGTLDLDFTVTNLGLLSPDLAEHVFLIPITPGVTILPDEHTLVGGLAENDTSSLLSSVISNAVAGTTVCFWITLHDETLANCCWQRCCIEVPTAAAAAAAAGGVPAHAGGAAADAAAAAAAAVGGGAGGPRFRQFRRGDSNLDAVLDLSDGVHVLGALFLGAHDLDCEDSSDSNDDGVVDLSDAVSIFNYLFTGGIAPPAPGPNSCGADSPGDDGLDCESYGSCG